MDIDENSRLIRARLKYPVYPLATAAEIESIRVRLLASGPPTSNVEAILTQREAQICRQLCYVGRESANKITRILADALMEQLGE